MPEVPAALGAVTLFVADVAASKAFYAAVFAASVVFEDDVSCVFGFGPTVVNLLQRTEAPTLVEPMPLAEPGPGCLLSVWVDDVDGLCAGLAESGIRPLNGPVDRPWGQRTAAFADPDGNVWELAQAIATNAT